MTTRPIIFSAPMVRAILDGRKTQTRRVAKLRDPSGTYATHDDDGWPLYADECGDWHRDLCPFGVPGDRLWVREKFAEVEMESSVAKPIAYAANPRNPDWIKWKSPIHMPRWASRITLEVTDVRVHRVQDISEADAIEEGCKSHYCSPEDTASCEPGTIERELAERLEGGFLTAKWDFECLWRSINAKRPGCSWNDNPWCWAIDFAVRA